jgi:hypothetical protein
MVLAVFQSPRARRRALWLGALVAAAATIAALNAALPKGGEPPQHFSAAPVQKVAPVRLVAMNAARRSAVNHLLDEFVPAAVARRDPARAYTLVTPALRSGISRAAWNRGNLPVFPYQPEGTTFHHWTVDYSVSDEIAVDVLLRPGPTQPSGSLAYTAVFKHERGQWLIDAFVPAASFAPDAGKKKQIIAQQDFTPQVRGGGPGGGQ